MKLYYVTNNQRRNYFTKCKIYWIILDIKFKKNKSENSINAYIYIRNI